ncbi:MAG TPA: cupin domain-containing protein [Pyrinomonadaceae bacterium]|nr:cupin domain-containing protein [Pyrinomonadaceae bacterium]
MPVNLEGGCRVIDMREGEAVEHGTLRIWSPIGRRTGAQAISLRVLEFAPGTSPGFRNETCDETFYVLERDEAEVAREDPTPQALTVFIDGWPFDVAAQTGIYLRPGQTFTFQNREDHSVVLISSRCPDPADSATQFVEPLVSPMSTSPEKAPLVRLADRAAQPTADRWYRVLVDNEIGSEQVTQFVGSIPPGRAPDHFHQYEEVLFILRGQGRMWASESNTPIARGSCIFLPRTQVHCVENIGDGELRLLGVFYPAGSPSVRYDVDDLA